MAIYHFHKKYVSRGRGSSVISAAAYRAAERLFDERRGRYPNFLRKTGVIHSEIMLPEGAPDRLADRATLWNEVDARERRKDARLADEIEVAIPIEMTEAQGVSLVHDFVAEHIVGRGMVADLNVHWDVGAKGRLNPHAHILLSTRTVGPDGFGQKERAWGGLSNLLALRKAWADHVNERLAMLDIDVRIDHRSLRTQGIDLKAQCRIGFAGAWRAARGEDAERADTHRRIARENGAKIIADPSIALDAITRSQSTFTTRDLAMFAHRHSDGQAQFERVMAAVRASPELVMLGQDDKRLTRFTSKEMVAIEQRLEQASAELVRRADHFVRDSVRDHASISAKRKGLLLSSEQQAALLHIGSPGGLTAVVGYAGTDKSTMLVVAREAWGAAGYRVRGAALSGTAAKNLEYGSGIASRTIASLEGQWGRGRELLRSRDVLVIDEAGMIGTRQMERVVTAARDGGAKVVLVGDPEQLQAIEAGAAFRSLVERHGAVEITAVRRQHAEWQREATQFLATGRTAEAVHAYQRHAMVQMAKTRDLARAELIERWAADQVTSPGRTRIILTHSNAEVRGLNLAARAQLRDAGELGEDVEMAAVRGMRVFASGDRVMFLKNDRGLGVKNGSLGQIEQVDAGRMTVRLDDEQPVSFALQDYAHVDQGYAAKIHKSQGITVDYTHVLATPGLHRHLTYVALSRHRDGLQLHYGRDDFDAPQNLVRTLSREQAKDMASDYGHSYEQELRAFANRRGFVAIDAVLNARVDQVSAPRQHQTSVPPDHDAPTVRQNRFDGSRLPRATDLDRDRPMIRRSMFDGLKLNAALALSSLRSPADRSGDAQAVSLALVRMSRAVLVIIDAQQQGRPILAHQKKALLRHIGVLDQWRPEGSRDLVTIWERDPHLLREAAAGRSGPVIDALAQEAHVRADPQLRARRFIARWQTLEREGNVARRDHDRDGATAAANALAGMANSLDRDPQVDAILRDWRQVSGLRREVGRDQDRETEIARTRNLGREQDLGR